MRLRKSIAVLTLVSLFALPTYAARERGREQEKSTRERIIRIVKRVIQFIAQDTGDQMSPPKP